MNPGRRRQPGLGVMLLLYQIFGVIGVNTIPPVTLATIGLHIGIFLRVLNFWRKPAHVCASVYHVLKRKEYARLVYAAFEHGDDWHLYYNMLSFAIKGKSLERRYGSVKFLYILTVFTVLTNVVLIALNSALGEWDSEFTGHCVIGFSGVIFALKVLTTYHDRNYTQQIMGFPITVPSKYAVWVELVLIQLVYPQASFVGHLAGILVGMAYALGPLKLIMDSVYSLVSAIMSPSVPTPRFTPRAEASGYARAGASGYTRADFTDFVPSGMTEEEQLRFAMDESLRQPRGGSPPYPSAPPPPGFTYQPNVQHPPPPGFAPDIDELRNRRRAHFS